MDCSGTIQKNTDHTWEFAGRNLIEQSSRKRIRKVIKPEDSETHQSEQLQRASNVPCAGDLNWDSQWKLESCGRHSHSWNCCPRLKKKKKKRNTLDCLFLPDSNLLLTFPFVNKKIQKCSLQWSDFHNIEQSRQIEEWIWEQRGIGTAQRPKKQTKTQKDQQYRNQSLWPLWRNQPEGEKWECRTE